MRILAFLTRDLAQVTLIVTTLDLSITNFPPNIYTCGIGNHSRKVIHQPILVKPKTRFDKADSFNDIVNSANILTCENVR